MILPCSVGRLPYRLHPRDQATLVPGVAVDGPLDGAFARIAARSLSDTARLAKPKITLRAKRAARAALNFFRLCRQKTAHS